TQTLHLIYDFHSAIRTIHRILKPGGVLLLTTPGISQLSNDEWAETWYWSFTPLSLRRAFDSFGDRVEIDSHGNVLAATAFLQGLATEELAEAELDVSDPQYPMLITLRATRSVDEVR